MIMELWVAIFITGGTYNKMSATVHPTKEQCVAALTIPEERYTSYLGIRPKEVYKPAKEISGICIKVDDVIQTGEMKNNTNFIMEQQNEKNNNQR